ncbi:hypothetical protein Z945_2828 [Sulfitobacter noctilucae]|uniref:hypothetical protein n=1 Tax=Sulfitobacter noctilucae TaxID=1342302 RepID=UPI00046A9F2A|nr:hypothetical protein [Sulfitobacter noctilucae]KIN74931.1 hypothetical protein Z945_2828 [Sulfitobacter noctilucae]
MAKTDIEIIYHLRDGRREPLGTGTIDETGHIDITSPREGQENYVKKQMDELNGRDYVVLKLPPSPGGSSRGVTKQKVYRTNPNFLPALKDYGRRVFSMEFIFHDFILAPHLAIPDEETSVPDRTGQRPPIGDS